MDSKSGKAPDVAPALLHKKMLQLLSSLWVTRAVGTFARLGLADVMEDGVDDHAAIAAARGLVPDRVYRLLRALEEEELVSSEWDDSTPGPAKRRYALTPTGERLLDQWVEALRSIVRNRKPADNAKLFHDNAVRYYGLK